jgi:hypothetical protein
LTEFTPETWLPVPGYEGMYEASDQGRIRSLARVVMMSDGRTKTVRERILRPGANSVTGYTLVDLYADGVRTTFNIHRLVMLAFVGPCPDGLEVCHNDGNRANNTRSNLRYDTRSANHLDSVRHGTHPFARKTHCKRGHELTPESTYPYDGVRKCRQCAHGHARVRYAANREQILAQHRARRDANREAYNAQHRARYHALVADPAKREEYNAQQRARYAARKAS